MPPSPYSLDTVISSADHSLALKTWARRRRRALEFQTLRDLVEKRQTPSDPWLRDLCDKGWVDSRTLKITPAGEEHLTELTLELGSE